MGAALEMLLTNMDKEVNKGTQEQKGDWMPFAFLDDEW